MRSVNPICVWNFRFHEPLSTKSNAVLRDKTDERCDLLNDVQWHSRSLFHRHNDDRCLSRLGEGSGYKDTIQEWDSAYDNLRGDVREIAKDFFCFLKSRWYRVSRPAVRN